MKRVSSLLLITIIIMIANTVMGQSRWSKIYHDDISAPKLNIIESYDHGYLISGRNQPNYPRYNWLIKTDVNGSVLWEKTIGNGINTIILNGMGMNNESDLYLSGSTMILDPYNDPFIIKLNECGEKEWCKIFSSPGNPDYANSLCITPDGGCAVILTMTGESGFVDRVCLVRFNKSGDFQWKQCYNSGAAMGNELCRDIILTPDNGYLLTGFCYHSNPGDTLAWLSPYYIKTDSLGNFEWETISGQYPANVEGIGWTTTVSPDNNYYYSSISHYYRGSVGDAPGLLKMDMLGNVVDIYDIETPNEIGILFEAKFFTDSTLVASAAFGYEYSSYPKAVIIDTIGNILDDQFLLNNIYMAKVRRTFDNKFLFYTQAYDEEEEQFDAYLFKLNQQLEDDTFYTYPFQYDTLCPYSIASDTIVQDNCDIIVGIGEEEEEMGRKGGKERMELYPNPAMNQINCRLSIVDCRYSIFILDMFGRKQEEIQIPKEQKEIQIDVSDYPQGIYIAVLRSEREMLDRKKFVVQ